MKSKGFSTGIWVFGATPDRFCVTGYKSGGNIEESLDRKMCIRDSFGIFRIDLHANLVTPNEDENPRFDLPWQVATLIKEWAQYTLCPYNFIFFGRGLIYQARGFSG